MIVVQLVQKPSIQLTSWEELGWELAFLTTCVASAITFIFFLLDLIGLGLFPLWFFIRWARVERIIN